MNIKFLQKIFLITQFTFLGSIYVFSEDIPEPLDSKGIIDNFKDELKLLVYLNKLTSLILCI